MKLTSKEFKDGQVLSAADYSGYGKGKFPALAISGVPKKAKSLALILHDKDVPGPLGITHLFAVELDPATKVLEANLKKLPSGRYLVNDLSAASYTPAMPPAGHGPHEYRFYLYALPHATLEESFSAVGYTYTKKTTPGLVAAVINFTKLDEVHLAYVVEKTA